MLALVEHIEELLTARSRRPWRGWPAQEVRDKECQYIYKTFATDWEAQAFNHGSPTFVTTKVIWNLSRNTALQYSRD